MSILELTVGASCSGKTTYAEGKNKKNFVNLNRDDLRMSLYGGPYHAYKFTGDKEDIVTCTQIASADSALSKGRNVIVSDTNLDPNRWGVWEQLAKKHKAEFVVTYFPVPLKELLDRNIKRDRSIPEKVIRAQVDKFETNFPDQVTYFIPKPYIPDDTKPTAYIFDVDGTLAHMNGKRGAFEWDKVGMDDPDELVIGMAQMLHGCGHCIIIMSGRDSVCCSATSFWLNDNGVPHDLTLMRPEGDFRPDTEVKEELFEKYVAPYYNVLGVFDDRNCVVDQWRKKGIKCFQVADGDF